ncbi:MAG: redoxin domain-containing protein, partial [Planctomycetes bacterium]|nr:redoxin domain-containing protein [Planctomycetota bacterium]
MSSQAADLLGRHLGLDELDWVNTPDNKPVKLGGKATLVRWWTDTCPSCAMSLPAIERLRKKFAKRGFQAFAVYHPKPPRDVAADDILRMAKAMEYTGWVAT